MPYGPDINMKNKTLKIGTRDSQLALWQAEQVRIRLEEAGFECELAPIKSDGDTDLVTPIYAMGVQGVFTKALDSALLNGKVDIVVHSMKDVPVQLAQGIALAAMLPRGSYKDSLVLKSPADAASIGDVPLTVATGSIRRKAQWLGRYPSHNVVPLRGNIATRLNKLSSNDWDGAIFALAGLERTGNRNDNIITLDWMLPSPAQGAVGFFCLEGRTDILKACETINDTATSLCVNAERAFLSRLMGGCSTPIGALAEIHGSNIRFRGNILSLDGADKVEIDIEAPVSDAAVIGERAAEALLAEGAGRIIDKIRDDGQ